MKQRICQPSSNDQLEPKEDLTRCPEDLRKPTAGDCYQSGCTGELCGRPAADKEGTQTCFDSTMPSYGSNVSVTGL